MPFITKSENAIAQLVERKVIMKPLLGAWVLIPVPPAELFLFSEKRGFTKILVVLIRVHLY